MKRNRKKLFLLIALALAIRVSYALAVGSHPLAEDEVQYDEIARNVVATGEFYQHFGEKTFYSFRAPLYPYFLAVLYATIGTDPLPVILLQCLLDAAVAGLLFLIAAKLVANRTVPVVSALLYSLYPYAIYRCTFLMTETLFAFLCALMVFVFITVERRAVRHPQMRPSVGLLVVCGVGLGVATLTKAGIALMGPLVVPWAYLVYRRPRQVAVATTLVCGAMALTLAPWTLRNWTIHKSFVPVATEGGVTLLGGNNAVSATSDEYLGFWYNPSGLKILSPGLGEVEESRQANRAAIAFLQDNTDQVPRMLLHKFLNTWVVHSYYLARDSGPARLARLTYTVLVPFSVVGMFLLLLRSRKEPSDWISPRIVWFLLLNVLVLCLIFYGSARFRAPVEPYLIFLAALPLARAWESLGSRSIRLQGVSGTRPQRT